MEAVSKHDTHAYKGRMDMLTAARLLQNIKR